MAWAGAGADTPGIINVGSTITLTNNSTTGTRYGQSGISSADLGGGAIGVVPFPFQEVDSEPDHGAVLPGVPTEIIVEFYGPIVQKDPSGPMPVVIEYADWDPLPAGCNDCDTDTACDGSAIWTNVSSNYSYTMHPGGNERAIKLEANTTPPGQFQFGSSTSSLSVPVDVVYRVRPRPEAATNTLVCDTDGDGTPEGREFIPPVDNENDGHPDRPSEPAVLIPDRAIGHVWQCDGETNADLDGNYMFFVGSAQTLTTTDTNSDGTIDSGDAIEWSSSPSDVNRDGIVDGNDLLHILNAQGELVDG